MAAKKSKSSGEVERDSGGRFVKGKSGNPRGRAKLPPNFKNYAKQAPDELWAIANAEDTPTKVKADILKWFTEMWFGKAPQALNLDGAVETGGVQVIKFEGVLDEWSQ